VTRPKLLHIKGSGGFGGDCVLILELARAAQEQGFEVDVLATDPHFQEMIRAEGLGLVDLDVIRREIRPLWDFRGLVRLIRFFSRSPYSIVHTHTSKPGIVGTLAARWSGIPAIIHTTHLFPFHEETGRIATAAYVGAERLAARWCDRIVTVSDFQRDWALRVGIGSPEKIVSIPNGVPTERARSKRSPAEVRAELGIGDAFMMLSTGRLAEQKGLEYLIRAAVLLRKDLPSARIVLAGDGPLEQRLSKLISGLELEDMVLLLGLRSDIGDLLAASDLVVLPSLWEGLSISLLEAMAAGKPVVTTTVGGNREVTNDGETAVLVPPKDPASLATAIRALAADAARLEELGRKGQEAQVERYTLQRMLDAYLNEYDRLLSEKRSQTSRARLPVEETS
jgi:glycosyltransferase involved in cell wall biosynthesis